MSTLNATPCLPVIPLPYIEAQYTNPRLPVFMKCLLYQQNRIDVAPALLREPDWLARVKRLMVAHYLDWLVRLIVLRSWVFQLCRQQHKVLHQPDH